jgi:hypothetical protein
VQTTQYVNWTGESARFDGIFVNDLSVTVQSSAGLCSGGARGGAFARQQGRSSHSKTVQQVSFGVSLT